MAPSNHEFSTGFQSLAGAVRTRLALRSVVAGATLGLVAAVPFATVAWAGRHGVGVPSFLGLGLAGAVAGALHAANERWSDHAVALFLDARLGTREVLSTAVEIDARGEASRRPATDSVLREAEAALRRATPAVLPTVLRRRHATGPLAIAVVLVLAVVPRPSAGVVHRLFTPPSPLVQLDTIPGLRPIEHLRDLSPHMETQRERLQALAAQATALRQQLRQGMDPRAASDAMRALMEALATERNAFGSGAEREGMQAAVRTLSSAGMQTAAAALAERDLAALDHAMERLANAREAADRQRAQEAIDTAASAAAQSGAQRVAEALREESSLLRHRVERNELLRRLAEQLARDPEVRRAAEHLDRERSDTSARELAQAMETALRRLTAAEREQLAQRMQQAAHAAQHASRAGDSPQGPSGQTGESQPQTAESIERALRDLLNSTPGEGGGENEAQGSEGGATMIPMPMAVPGGSGQGDVQRALDQALAGGNQAQGQMGGRDGQGGMPGGQGGGRGGGAGEHVVSSGIDPHGTLQARARSRVLRGGTLPGGFAGLTSGRSGATARVLRTGDLRAAAADEIHGVERSDVPAAYRQQVRTYFQP